MEVDEKACPACAETVKAAAKVCKHCGINFGVKGIGNGATAPGETRGGCGLLTAIICGAIVLFVIVFMVGALGEGKTNHRSYDRMTAEQKAAEDHRQRTGLYPEQETEIIEHCKAVPRPWDC